MMQVLHRRRPLDGELAIRRQAHIGMVFFHQKRFGDRILIPTLPNIWVCLKIVYP